MWILPKQLHALSGAPDTEAFLLDLNEQSQACAQSLLVRSKPSPARTWLLKWKRDSWTQHLFGRILKPSHANHFEIAWTSLWQVIPANHSAQQESDLEPKTLDTSGLTSPEQFLLFDLDSVSSRMSKVTSRWDSPQSSAIWKNWVTRCRGAWQARLKSARLTSGKECSSWPTSNARDWKGPQGRAYKGISADLPSMVEMHGQAAPANHNTDGSRQGWSTPTTTDAAIMSSKMRPSRIATGRTTDYLARQVQWATPIMGDSHLASTPEVAQKRIEEGKATLSRQNPGKLNPRWVETLMGLPVGWVMPSCKSPVTIALTNCDSSATESCLPQQPELF